MHALISPVGHESRARVSDDERNHLHTVSVNERTPLIRNGNNTERINTSYTPYIVGIMVLMLVTGIIIGTYLLIEQDKQWPVNIPFELIMRDNWDLQQYDKPLLGLGVTKQANHLILTQTDTKECYEILECKELLREMQMKNPNNTGGFEEVPYNFLISSNGMTYEGRGWDRIGAVDPEWDDSSISLAFIGDFESKRPTKIQVHEAAAFIDEAISRKKLSPSYSILGKFKARRPRFLFREFQRWKQWDDIRSDEI